MERRREVTLLQDVPLPEPSQASAASDEAAVRAAARLFLERGIGSVKMTDVADGCGVGVATLYRHFSTKTDLAIEAATLLWGSFHASFRELVATSSFDAESGLGKLRLILDQYRIAYREHPDFVAFLDEFDRFVLDERVDVARLEAYGSEVNAFYPVLEEAYRLGRADGSIAREVDFGVFFQAVAHALMGVAEKLVRGEVLPTDDFSHGEEELECIVSMAIESLGGATR
ncbi:MAG: TetR/AcrR family transcriptional regulator [Atopobiaceae bacterium]|jgi:AcrR family transcriptional regulator|nr:TetR/AcrR family transcriptional regulator [Atopobiaceae bacterium]